MNGEQIDRVALAEALMHVYDHGWKPNAFAEADEVIRLLSEGRAEKPPVGHLTEPPRGAWSRVADRIKSLLGVDE